MAKPGTGRSSRTDSKRESRTSSKPPISNGRAGRIVKALSGYYYVEPDDPGHGSALVQCRARGIFKMKGLSPLVGDNVIYSDTENGEGTIEEIRPRSTELIRPPVANADLAVLVFSVREPALNLQLLDKFLVHIEHAGLETLLCLSKRDLAAEEAAAAADEDGPDAAAPTGTVADVQRIYGAIGYEVLVTSSLTGDGLEELLARLQGRISVVAGQSGVGKSSLLNALMPELELETNAISMKLGRGKHTTRHVELMKLPEGGYVADTPGFSQLDFLELGIEELGSCFREFRERSDACKFRGCTHVHEPDCAVLQARARGEIAESRYESYLQFMAEMKEKKRRY